MTSAERVTLTFRTALLAPPERVFAALTRPEHLARWFCDEAESDARAGGGVRFRWRRANSSEHPFTGEWVAFEAPSRCAFTGGHPGYPGGTAGRVEFTLEPDGAGTRLVTAHALPASIEYTEIASTYTLAWPRALDRLAAYLTPREAVGVSA